MRHFRSVARRMRPREAISEGARNLTSGTSRPLLFACAFVLVMAGLALADIRSIVSISVQAETFRNSGAAVKIVSAPGSISGPRCDMLGSLPGVVGAGAIRQSDVQANFSSSPQSGITHFDATSGFAPIIDVNGRIATGVWLSESAAESVGAESGTILATSHGPLAVSAVYSFPAAASDRTLAHAAISPVPSAGLFDSCWVLSWPSSQALEILIRGTYAGDPEEQGTAVYSQLTTQFGADFNGEFEFQNRATRSLPLVAIFVGLSGGAAFVWMRRLEFADALHAQIPKSGLLGQLSFEYFILCAAAVFISLPITLHAAKWGNPDPFWPAWQAGLRVVVAGMVSAFMGALLLATTTSPKRLFRFFKDR